MGFLNQALPADRVGPPGRRRILVIDDEADIRESLELLLTSENYSVDLAENATIGLQKFDSANHDLVLLDLMLPDRSGMEVLADIRLRDQETPIFMLTAYGSEEVAVRALKSGANDYFPKPWDNDKLLIEIDRMISKGRLERENTQLKRALKQRYAFPNIVGKSERMLRLLDQVAQVAPSRATILITGETGTGKELIAKAIHAHSARADQMFVPVNSGSLPSELLESILFGHVKGSFTGAVANRKGLFETANRGTIFFDEIGTVGPEIQVKLLRVLQDREFMPLGSNESVRVDVRIVAATNADLKKQVDEGKFREDLYYRLNVINLNLPPLRERKEDIPFLAMHFVTKLSKELGSIAKEISPAAMDRLLSHPWPGNVRELENTIERSLVLASQEVLQPADMRIEQPRRGPNSAAGLAGAAGQQTPLLPEGETLEHWEQMIIKEAMRRASNNKSQAARMLGLTRNALRYRLSQMGLESATEDDGQ